MKTLSIKQPWLDLILAGDKTIEIRTWKTNYRGVLLLHASQTEDKEACSAYRTDCAHLPKGYILGVCYLRDVKEYSKMGPFTKDRFCHWNDANQYPGRKCYGWLLEGVRRLPAPICVKGKLGLWDYPM